MTSRSLQTRSCGRAELLILVFTISMAFFLPDADVRLLTGDDLPYEEPLGVQHSTTMLLGIFTNESEKQKWAQKRIRDTYLKEENLDPRVCKLSEYIRQTLDSEGTHIVCRIPYVFVVGGDPERPTDHTDNSPLEIDAPTVKEASERDADDFVYLNIKENDHTGKATTYFKWASTLSKKYQIDYIAQVPTTTLIDMKLMLTSLDMDLAPFPHNRRIYGGNAWGAYKKSLVFADNEFYFLSSDLAEFIAYQLTVEKRKKLTLEPPDAARDIGTFVYAHPKTIRFHFTSNSQFWHSPLESHEEWYDAWETKMGELPLKRPIVPFHEICDAMVLEGNVKVVEKKKK